MRLKKGFLISLALAVMLSLSIATPVMAVPQMPHAFYGTVTVGDGAAADGVLISAKIGGVEYATTNTLDGKYGYSPTFKVSADDPDTDQLEGGVEGDTIDFCIEDIQVASYTFSNGEVTELHLHIEELPSPPPVGGGGAPTYYYTDTSLFGTEKNYRISSKGEILQTIEATSEDGMLTVTIPRGTIALGEDGKRLKGLEAAVDESPPDPPEDAHIIGQAYDFGPAGATFIPGIILTWSYDPDEIPEGVAEEDLVIAYYDGAEWVELEDCEVDTENDTITASVSHFTTFAIVGAVTVEEEVVVEEEEVVVEEEEEVVEEEEEVVEEEEEEVVEEEEEEEVLEVPAPINWPLIGGIIAAVVIVAGLVIFFVLRRRAA